MVITGEVRSPGTYTLLSKNDRMSDVIARAGGPTRAAYTDGVAFYRRAGRLGRIGVDLPGVLRDPNNRDNLVLQDGDSLDIPAFTGVVEVQGSVNSPRGVAYLPGKNLMFYIRAAGGESKTGDTEHSYVTQSDGKVQSYIYHRFGPDFIPQPTPGSMVFVPEKPTVTNSDALARLGIVAPAGHRQSRDHHCRAAQVLQTPDSVAPYVASLRKQLRLVAGLPLGLALVTGTLILLKPRTFVARAAFVASESSSMSSSLSALRIPSHRRSACRG